MKNQRSCKITGQSLLVPILISLTTIGGCATTGTNPGNTQQSKVEEAVEEHKETAIGAALLGALGAGLGYALAGEKGAAIGGGAGLALGAGAGQVLKAMDKRRIEAVSEAGHRTEQGDNEVLARSDDSAESTGEPSPTESKTVVTAAMNCFPAPCVATTADLAAVSEQVNEASNVEAIYDILRNGKVIGAIQLDHYDSRSFDTGSVSLCQASSLASCARLELRRR